MIEDTLEAEANRQEDAAAKTVLLAAATAIKALRRKLDLANHRLRKLIALENAGVDNWSGYDHAMEDAFADEEDEG